MDVAGSQAGEARVSIKPGVERGETPGTEWK